MSNFHCALCGSAWVDRSSEGYTAGCRHTIQEATGPSISGMKAERDYLKEKYAYILQCCSAADVARIKAEAENAELLALLERCRNGVSALGQITLLTEIDAARGTK